MLTKEKQAEFEKIVAGEYGRGWECSGMFSKGLKGVARLGPEGSDFPITTLSNKFIVRCCGIWELSGIMHWEHLPIHHKPLPPVQSVKHVSPLRAGISILRRSL